MHIYCLGLNHTTTSVALREKLSLSEEVVRSALSRLACGHLASSLAELIILSTCNRTELYTVSSQAGFAELEMFLSEVSGVPASVFRPHLYRYRDVEVACHLFDVAAGLDSLVIGEPQILGQVTRALELARGQNMAGPILNRLFQAAIHAGKRARTETHISRNPASVSSLAASLAERVVHPIAEAQVVILGAGEMAELAVEALRKRGAQKILVVNRTLERARAIAVPRDIDPAAADVPNVKLYDIDHLHAQLEDSLSERLAEAPKVRALLEEELAEFARYLHSLDMLPIIAEIRQRAEAIRQAELEKTLRRLPNLTEGERARIEAMTQALVKQILHAPTQRLRAEAPCPHAPEYATVARTLFDLQNEGLCGFSGQACPISNSAD
ncbi:MAG: glutamyl-tRNA reductase [Anaerolineales bacterium]|nr:glutamyl-tRNA reductase [Anaerolineales bacterium]